MGTANGHVAKVGHPLRGTFVTNVGGGFSRLVDARGAQRLNLLEGKKGLFLQIMGENLDTEDLNQLSWPRKKETKQKKETA